MGRRCLPALKRVLLRTGNLNSGKEPEEMNYATRLATVVAVAAVLLTTAGCNKLRARDQLNKGVQAYKSGAYEAAIEHFKNAVAFDDDLRVAKLYLATAYRQ